MLKAHISDKNEIIDILAQSFIDNKSVNYIIPQDAKRIKRIKNLMSYSFELCYRFGEVLFSDDKKAVALVIYPDKKTTSFKTIWLDIKFIMSAIGIFNIQKAIKREAAINQVHPKRPLAYLWFIGVRPPDQLKGAGTQLLNEIINHTSNKTICLETSTERNLPWYKKNGFETYKELDFGYKLYCMKLE